MSKAKRPEGLGETIERILQRLEALENKTTHGDMVFREGSTLFFRDGGTLRVEDESVLAVEGGGSMELQDGGDFVITEGGNLIIRDGGGVTVRDGGGIQIRGDGSFEVFSPGEMIWRDDQGRIRGAWGHQTRPDGTRLQEIAFIDTTGNVRANIGEVQDFTTGNVTYGLLVEAADDSDLLYVVPERFIARRFDDDDILNVAPGEFDDYFWLQHNDRRSMMEITTQGTEHTVIRGGAATTGQGMREAILFVGNDSNAREIQFQDGAISSYIDIAAGGFVTRSSSAETKTVLGDVEPGALDRVRNTPVKRWRHEPAPENGEPKNRAETLEQPTEGPERIGPLAEDARQSAPKIVNDEQEGSGIDLGASLWELWAAVQEQAAEIDRLKARVAELEQS